jgi:hypothetical protein
MTLFCRSSRVTTSESRSCFIDYRAFQQNDHVAFGDFLQQLLLERPAGANRNGVKKYRITARHEGIRSLSTISLARLGAAESGSLVNSMIPLVRPGLGRAAHSKIIFTLIALAGHDRSCSALHSRSDPAADLIGRGAHRVRCKVSVACSRHRLIMPQEPANHRQAHAGSGCHAGKAVAQVMNAYVSKVGSRTYAPPGLLQIDQAATGLPAGNDIGRALMCPWARNREKPFTDRQLGHPQNGRRRVYLGRVGAMEARKQADRLTCEAWNKRMLAFKGPAQPSPGAWRGAEYRISVP